MKRKRKTLLCLEQLENRWLPAPVLSNGNLTVAGIIPAAVTAVNVNQQADGTWTVLYNATPQGNFTVTGNITVNTTGSQRPAGVNTNVLLDPANNLPGNLSITTGNGASDTVRVDTSAAPTTGGQIRGYLFITLGNGTDTANVGNTNGLIVGSLTQISAGPGNDSATIGNGTNPTNLRSDVVINGIDTLTVGAAGAATEVGGNLVVSNSNKSLPNIYTLNATSTVDKSLTIVGGIAADSATLAGTVSGATTLSLGGGSNTFIASAGAFFGNDTTYTGGSGHDLVQINPTGGTQVAFTRNLSLNMGDGTNDYTLAYAFIVGANMNITAGNGDNNVGIFGGTINGSLYITFGNGNNIFNFDGAGTIGTGAARVGNKVVYNSGTGNNSFEVSTGGSVVTLNITFGTGNDTFTIDSAADEANLTGFLNWGDSVFGNDTFNEPAGGAFILPWTFYGVQ